MIKNLSELYKELTTLLIDKNITISTMESCTSGLVACLITDTEGASAVMKGSFVTYCNEAKIMCGIPEKIISKYGVYSQETAVIMAETAKKRFSSDIGIGITGTFGNVDLSNHDSIIGHVFYAIQFKDELYNHDLSLSPGLLRSEYKKIVAEKIANDLLHIINN